MPAKEQRTRLAVAAGAIVLLIAGGAYLHGRAATARLDQIEQLQAEVENHHAVENALQTLKAQSQSQGRSLEQYQQTVPQDANLSPLIERLGLHLTRNDVHDRSVTTGSPTAGTRFSALPLNLQFRGSFHATSQVLRDLESDPQMMRLQEIQLRRHFDRPEEPLSVTIQIKTFSHVNAQP